jgi:hypothetical protein
MQTLHANTRGLSLLMSLNLDRLLYLGMIGSCLALSAYVASITTGNPFIL